MLLENTSRGLYCPAGEFYVDPWQPVDCAIITHAHSDHARFGSRSYLTEQSGKAILQLRLGPDARIDSLAYGETITRRGVHISLHPAGHLLGSAQVRIEHGGEVCVVSGDYKLENDGTCPPFEPIRCHTFITESTFALPIYHWRPQAEILREIHDWWRANQLRQRTSVLFCYALGKAQRILAGLDPMGPIYLHGAVERYLPAYLQAGARFPPTAKADAQNVKEAAGTALVLAPTSAVNSPWLRKFGEVSTAFASGWMQIRGARRRRALDRGFVLSDHADWEGLLKSIQATGASRVWVTHGYSNVLARYLNEKGLEAESIPTQFHGEIEDDDSVQSGAEAQPPLPPPSP